MTRLTMFMCLAAVLLLGACAGADDIAVGSDATEPAAPASPTAPDAPAVTEGATVAEEPTVDAPEESAVQSLPDPATGVLGLEEIEGGCVVMELDGQRYQLIAAPDAEVVVDPGNGVIAATDGTVIARAGDTITVQGVIDPGMMTFCQVGPVLLVDSVTVE